MCLSIRLILVSIITRHRVSRYPDISRDTRDISSIQHKLSQSLLRVRNDANGVPRFLHKVFPLASQQRSHDSRPELLRAQPGNLGETAGTGTLRRHRGRINRNGLFFRRRGHKGRSPGRSQHDITVHMDGHVPSTFIPLYAYIVPPGDGLRTSLYFFSWNEGGTTVATYGPPTKTGLMSRIINFWNFSFVSTLRPFLCLPISFNLPGLVELWLIGRQ